MMIEGVTDQVIERVYKRIYDAMKILCMARTYGLSADT